MRYYVESYGCTMNFGEGRKLSADMASMGYIESASAEDADIVILNTCTVVETTEKRMLSRISELKKMGKEIIVTGCMAKAQPKRIEIRLPESMIIPPEGYHEFAREVAERYGIAGQPIPIKQGTDAILPIAQGCLGNCSYCITKIARGNLLSYPADGLVNTFNGFVENGAKEILLTAQDTACYGGDIGTNLEALVRSMLQKDGEYRIRIGMMNPNNLMRVWEGLVSTFDDERMYRFLHIPVQSGSNSILKAMRRHYSVEEFIELVDNLRNACPDVSIATDIISGFPGETDKDHQKSMELIHELRMDTVNITRFSARPGTDAFVMTPVHGRIAKERSAELTRIKNETEMDVNASMVGRSYHCLATEIGKEGTILRTGNYRPIVVREKIPLGTFIDAKVEENKATYLLGKVI